METGIFTSFPFTFFFPSFCCRLSMISRTLGSASLAFSAMDATTLKALSMFRYLASKTEASFESRTAPSLILLYRSIFSSSSAFFAFKSTNDALLL